MTVMMMRQQGVRGWSLLAVVVVGTCLRIRTMMRVVAMALTALAEWHFKRQRMRCCGMACRRRDVADE